MEFIEKANLFFILPISDDLVLKPIEDDSFVRKLKDVQDDEFSDKMNDNMKRHLLLSTEMFYGDKPLGIKVYSNEFGYYNTSLLYVNIKINDKMTLKSFGILINSSNFLTMIELNKTTLLDKICSLGIPKYELQDSFLFIQLNQITPPFPIDYDEGIKYIQENKYSFHKILLRSDTEAKALRVNNHQKNFESISNFYGTIDLCSPITLLQIYQYDIQSATENEIIYDIDHRACWWLTITDIIFIQKSILSNALKTINSSRTKDKKRSVKTMNKVEKVLIDMQEYWYFEDYTHEITKKVVDKVKDRIGIATTLNSVLNRVESLENAVLREINEEQNEYNKYLNLILFIIAIIQIVPLVHEITQTVVEDAAININQLFLWGRSFIISISFPLLVFVVSFVGKSIRTRNERILKNNLNRRSIDESY